MGSLLRTAEGFPAKISSLKNHRIRVQLCLKGDLPSTTTQEIKTTDERSKIQEGSRHHEEKKIQIDMVQKIHGYIC